MSLCCGEKRTGENITLKKLFEAKKGDFPAEWKQQSEAASPNEATETSLKRAIKIDCDRVERLTRDYQTAMQFGSRYDPLIKTLTRLTQTVGLN